MMCRTITTLRTARRGSTALIAMLFLTLFTALAVGFYSTATMSVQVAGNEQRASRSQLASNSGMQFMKYHLATLGIPPKTPPAELFGKVYERLAAKLNNSLNMPAAAPTIDLVEDGTLIRIPGGGDNWIAADAAGSAFRAEIRKLQAGEKIEVRVFGRYGNANSVGSARGVKLEYANMPNPAAIFNYGVASESPISMNGKVTIRGTPGNEHMGSVLSAHTATNVPLTMTGSPVISGHVSFVNPNAAPSISSQSTIANLSPGDPGFNDVIHRDVPRPEFPMVDTTAFAQYVPAAGTTGPSVITTSTPSGTYFKNIRIKAGANPTFASNTLIQGVILIEQPNDVKFSGGVTIQGVIVTPVDAFNNAGANLSANKVTFTGTSRFQSVSSLPATSDFPAGLRQLTGSTLLVPGFTATFSGNFGTVGGSIIASQIGFGGTSGGTIKGSVINLRDSALTLAGTSDIIVESQGTSNHPAGVFFGSRYSPLPFTYAEIRLEDE
jgi:hypothetical protein